MATVATRRPVIGITCYVEPVDRPPWVAQASALLPRMSLDHIARAGGIPVILPPVATETADPADEASARDQAAELLTRVDGLVLAGGADIEASRYAALPHPTAQAPRPDRDAWELTLAQVSAELDLPTLGVCRGMQVMAVAAGGTLHQHLPEMVGTHLHLPAPGVWTRHTVTAVAGTRVAAILGTDPLDIPTYHHQGVATHPGYRASAWAPDGVLEAMEATAGTEATAGSAARFRVAVQWHPEAGEDGRLFGALVAAAARG